ncbi:nuclear factor NF-kappa-B p105 subunit [Nematostella vectensis]|uniref:nuclear factor NF-kappa-B p105 subunit n=1 Tax=Nematostella vectensis TaxID=45351 RepID=UPI002077435E|nr:nuclear factor NF-kappa-B p105 subunit [Nematostella vectensis]
MASGEHRNLVRRGAPMIPEHRAALLEKCHKSEPPQGKDFYDSGFGGSLEKEADIFEREQDKLVEATREITLDESPIYGLDKKETEQLQCTPPPQMESDPISDPEISQSQSISPHDCVLSYAAGNDVRCLLAPMRGLLFAQDEDGDTALHLAIIHTNVQAVENIVAVAPSTKALDIFNYLRQTPLHLATITKQSNIVRGLIASGASVDLVDRNGKTALHLACERGDIDSVREIIRPLSDKAYNPKTREEISSILNTRNYDGFTALHVAVFSNSIDIVSALTNVGADINVPDCGSGKTALHHAVETNNLRLVSYLLFQCNACVDAETFDECTPLHFAAGRGMESMAALLLAAGADPTLPNRTGATPLDEAADNVRPMLQLPESPF